MALQFTCERDDVVIRAASDEQLVKRVERHAAEHHPDLVGSLTRQDILAMASVK